MPESSASMAAAARGDAHNLAPLLDAALAGDVMARDALLVKLRPYLHSLLGKRFGGQLDHSAIVQEGLIRVVKYLPTLQRPTVPHLLAWAKKIVTNLAIDEQRRHRYEAERISGAAKSDLARQEAGSMEIQERMRMRLTQALQRLPKRRRQVIELSFFEKLSDVEIGRRLCGSPGAVRVLRFRAVKELRGLLEILSESDHSSRDFSACQPKQVDHENECRSGKLE
jgi:RNA polymerase sigma-70 factor (ECF subfamily)